MNNSGKEIIWAYLIEEMPRYFVATSMKWLSSLAKIVIDPNRCPVSTEEFTTYEFEQDKDGNYISGYVDAGVARPRVFRITKIVSDLEFPDAFTCAIVPIFDQYIQKNQYTLVNHEKINQDESNRTSKDQPYKYITDNHEIDNTPKENIEYENKYSFINDKKSPYSG